MKKRSRQSIQFGEFFVSVIRNNGGEYGFRPQLLRRGVVSAGTAHDDGSESNPRTSSTSSNNAGGGASSCRPDIDMCYQVWRPAVNSLAFIPKEGGIVAHEQLQEFVAVLHPSLHYSRIERAFVVLTKHPYSIFEEVLITSDSDSGSSAATVGHKVGICLGTDLINDMVSSFEKVHE